MATFFYKAVAKGGGLVDGNMDGADETTVAVKLQDMGLIPILIGTRKSSQPWRFDFRWRFRKVGSKEVMFLTQELSTLVNAGLRFTRYSMFVKDNALQPRISLAYFIRKTGRGLFTIAGPSPPCPWGWH